ncbi:MAG: hypothetical protein JNM18_14525 [Planctomycetaceae bacterium]|nr:hypothetical protein [Planctomycetaceae bacterium]
MPPRTSPSATVQVQLEIFPPVDVPPPIAVNLLPATVLPRTDPRQPAAVRSKRQMADTSIEAGRTNPDKKALLQMKVLRLIASQGTNRATASEIDCALELLSGSAGKRCSDLRKAGLVTVDGARRLTISGCAANVLVVTRAGKQLLQTEH